MASLSNFDSADESADTIITTQVHGRTSRDTTTSSGISSLSRNRKRQKLVHLVTDLPLFLW
jgi:hypothetical protein